jgi:DNA-binding transcriptional LysR family regulator
MEIRQLQYFATIVRTGGFRNAADALCVSQATLSEQIKALEHELGVRLVERSGRSLSLTTAGSVLLVRAERLLADVKATREEMLEYAQLERGQLVTGAVIGCGTSWLPSFLAAFLQRHPNLEVRLVERTSSLLVKLLENADIHVACLLIPAEGAPDVISMPGISTRRVFTRDLVVVVSRDHRLARRRSISLEELATEPLILTSLEETPRLIVDQAFHGAGLEPQVRFEANDPTALLGLAAEGVGVGITGKSLAREFGERVATLDIEGLNLRYSLALAWSQRGPHTRAMATYLDFATDWFANSTWGRALNDAQAIAP